MSVSKEIPKKQRQKEQRKEGNVLFNDTLNIFIYGYMVLDIW